MTAAAALEHGLRELALDLSPGQREQLLDYVVLLEKWNRTYNLTAVREPLAMVSHHLLDSLALLPHLPLQETSDARVADVGSGAGLPGIPLAIANPQLQVTLLDSNGKKTRFLRHVQRTLDLANVEVVEARLEDFEPGLVYTAIVCRAFGALGEFIAQALRLVAPGGRLVAMKGKLDRKEVGAIPAAAVIKDIRRLNVPGLAEERHLIVAAVL